MNPVKRFEKLRSEPFDRIMLLLKNGGIKCGRYAHRIKIDPKFKVRKEPFKDGKDEDSGE